ncbi:MAG: hypothetical protein IT462_14700 [Planctomycetes bacterium]|nr:hypothetical protein [Planctomycetota bacterium]
MGKRNDKTLIGALVIMLLLGGGLMVWRPWEKPRPRTNETEIADTPPQNLPVNVPKPVPKAKLPADPPKDPPKEPPKETPKEAPKLPEKPAPEPDENFTFRARQRQDQPYEGSQEVRFILSGTVEDANGAGLPDWHLMVETWIWNPDPKTVVTPTKMGGNGADVPVGKSGEGGRFRVDAFVNVPPGWKTAIWIRAYKFPAAFRIPAVVVEPNGAYEVSGIRLAALLPASFSFRLVGEDGQPLKNVPVDLLKRAPRGAGWPDIVQYDDAEIASAATNAEGIIVFKDASPGDYDVFYSNRLVSFFSEQPLSIPSGGDAAQPQQLGDVHVVSGVWLTWTTQRNFRTPPFAVTKVSAVSETGTTAIATHIGIGIQTRGVFIRCTRGESYRVNFYYDGVEKAYEVAKFVFDEPRKHLGDIEQKVD